MRSMCDLSQCDSTGCHLRLPEPRLILIWLGDSRFYESVSVLSASKRDWLDRQWYRWDYRLRPPQSNRRVVLSFCPYFHRFVFLFTTSSHVFGTSVRATARAEPLPPVPLVWFDLPLSISGCCRYWTQFVAAVAHSKETIYLAGSLNKPSEPLATVDCQIAATHRYSAMQVFLILLWLVQGILFI
jgi:hypothetical protein